MIKKSLILGSVATLVVTAFAAGKLSSGLQTGERVTPFHPQHISGPLANTENCFPCTFQNRPQVQAWINGDSHTNIMAIAKTLNSAMGKYKGSEFKALVVFLTDAQSKPGIEAQLKAASKMPGMGEVGMAVLDKSSESVADYKINTSSDVKNTVFVYKNWQVQQKFVNIKADANGISELNHAIASIAK